MTLGILKEDARRIQKLLSSTKGMVLATTHANGSPEAARVNFVTGDAFTLYFCTSHAYRKAANIKRHNRVAVVVSTDRAAVQIEGTATRLPRAKIPHVLRQLARKYGKTDPYLKNHAAFYQIKPHWLRYVDKLGREPAFYTFGDDGHKP